MNEQTTKLIQQLADKLGTTANQIWQTLVAQAPINSVCNILIYIAVAIMTWIYIKGHKSLLRVKEYDPYSRNESGYEHYDLGATIPMVVLGIALIFLIIGCLLSIDSTISGFINPNYWALRKILDVIKN